jgi:hypothetical protein
MDLREGGCVLDAYGSGYGPVAVSFEYGNEPSYSINDEEFLE